MFYRDKVSLIQDLVLNLITYYAPKKSKTSKTFTTSLYKVPNTEININDVDFAQGSYQLLHQMRKYRYMILNLTKYLSLIMSKMKTFQSLEKEPRNPNIMMPNRIVFLALKKIFPEIMIFILL